MKKENKDYNFNICTKCQKDVKDVPCDKDCIYLKEKLKNEKSNS